MIHWPETSWKIGLKCYKSVWLLHEFSSDCIKSQKVTFSKFGFKKVT